MTLENIEFDDSIYNESEIAEIKIYQEMHVNENFFSTTLNLAHKINCFKYGAGIQKVIISFLLKTNPAMVRPWTKDFQKQHQQ